MDQLRLVSPVDAVARAQAGRVRALLEARPETLATVTMIFENPPNPADLIGRLAARILEGDADAAVCPADRLPLRLPTGIALGAVLRDRRATYRCVGSRPRALAELPAGARVGVCDAIARAQILHAWPHLRVELVPACAELLDALRARRWEAACLPAELLEAGSLADLRYDPVAAEEVLPAVGLGVVAVLARTRSADGRKSLVREINDPEVASLLDIERAFLAHAPKDPGTAITARAERSEELVRVIGLIADGEGDWLVRDEATAGALYGRVIAREVAESCADLARKERARTMETNWVAS